MYFSTQTFASLYQFLLVTYGNRLMNMNSELFFLEDKVLWASKETSPRVQLCLLVIHFTANGHGEACNMTQRIGAKNHHDSSKGDWTRGKRHKENGCRNIKLPPRKVEKEWVEKEKIGKGEEERREKAGTMPREKRKEDAKKEGEGGKGRKKRKRRATSKQESEKES